MLAGLGLGAGVAVGTVGAAIGLASARQEVKTTFLVLYKGIQSGKPTYFKITYLSSAKCFPHFDI